MANSVELQGIYNEGSLLARIRVQTYSVAADICDENPATVNYANRIKWARAIFRDKGGEIEAVHRAVIAKNIGATAAQINNATDATIKSNIASVVNWLADGT